MTIADFAAAVVLYATKYGASTTRWGSTDRHSVAVGGWAGDPHTWWLGIDFLYDDGPHRPSSETHPRSPHSCPTCSEFDLKIIHEDGAHPHDHAQPMDFPPGPVTDYRGVHRSLA